MDNEEMNIALYNQISAEQDKYQNWLLTQPPEGILEHAYEYTVREDILMAMECLDLTDEKVAALLSSSSLLSDIFAEFDNLETDYMDIIRECIESHADDMCKQKELPIYPHSFIYAQEHEELSTYFDSQKANTACRDAIEQSILAHYHDNRLDSKKAVQQVFSQFGVDRTLYVLAATVQANDRDGRFSLQNKQWAKTVPIVEDIDSWGRNRTTDFVVDAAHLGLVDLFLNQAKREHVKEQGHDTGKGQKEKAGEKPSIKGQLSVPSVPGDKSAPNKDREVR